MAKVITYGVAGRGETIDLTRTQERMLRRANLWPRNRYGHYTSVHHGLHQGEPTYTDSEIAAAIETGKISDHIALV